MTHLYSKEGVTAVTSPHASAIAESTRLSSSGTAASVKPPLESIAADNVNPEEPALETRTEKVSTMSAADRAMSELSQPLQTFHSPRHTRYHHHYHHYSVPKNPPPVSSTMKPRTDDQAARFSEALRSQQEMSSRLASNVAAFRQDPVVLHSAAAAAAAATFTDQALQQQQSFAGARHPSLSPLDQSAALRDLSARVVAPPHAAGNKAPPFSRDAPGLLTASRQLVEKKQFPFLDRTSFYSGTGAGTVKKHEQ